MDFDLLIIGAGPAGYVAAIRAGQLGLKTAVIEREQVGGMCLNWGCIPTKSMLESAKLFQRIQNASPFGIDGIDARTLSFNWKTARKRSDGIVRRLTLGVSGLLKKNAVHVINGEAEIISETTVKVNKRVVETAHMIIATGSVPEKQELPVPKQKVMEIREFLAQEQIPDQLVVLGQGPNAMELAQLVKMIGKEVALVVTGKDLLPGIDPYVEDFAVKQLKKDGINVLMDGRITGSYENGILVGDEKIACKIVINSALRTAVIPTGRIDLQTENGFIKVDDYLRTNVPNIFAVGDVNGRSALAHVASAQGLNAVNTIKGIRKKMIFSQYPLNIYSEPEIAQVGLTEPDLREEGIDYKVSEFPLSANAKSLVEGHRAGFLRMLSDKKYGEVLGVQIVAPNATDIISEAAAIIAMEGTVYDVVNVAHAHPTISEVYMEAGFAAIDKAIHI